MPENLPIGEQIVKTGGFPRTAQDIYNSPTVSGGTSIFDAPKSSNDKTSLSTVNPILPSQVDVSGRFPKQILGADNEDLFAQGQSTGEKWWNASKKMVGIAGATFLENTVGLLDGLGEWVSTGNISSLWNNSVNTSLNEWTQGLENSSPNYYSAKERNASFLSADNLLTANFWADKVMKNLGFSVGSIGGGLAWGAVLRGIGLTGAIAKAGSNMEQFASGLETAVQNAPKAERTFSALQYIEDASKSLVGAVGSGLTKADRAIVAALGTYGEASIEALNNYTQFKNDRIRDFELKNGYKPSGSELDEIEKQASHVGNWSMGLNMALLSATNYIQLPKILNMSGKAEKAIINGVETQPLKQVGENIISALPEKGFAKRLYQAKNLSGLLFNPVEGFEEGAQNVIQEGTQDFFNKKYNNQDASFGDSLGYATKKTLTSKEGLEQILIGALSGGLQTSGFHSLGRTGNIKERGFTGYGGERAKVTQEAIDTLNKSKFSQALRDNVDAFNRAQTLQSQREAALRQGDILEAKDLEREYQFNYLYPRIKYGKFDFVQEDINSYKNAAATEAGFKELQRQGIANDTDSKEDFLKRLTNFEEHAKAVKKSYEYLNNKYGSNKEFTDKIVDRLAYNLSKIQNYDDRIKELSSELLKKGISIQEILDEIHKGSPKKETVKNALSQIEGLNDVSSIKDDLKQQLQDVTELSLRRKQYTSNYNNIVKTPKNYATLDTDFENEKEATIRQRDDEGKSKPFTAEVGKEYSISDDGIFRDGNTLTFNPKLIILNNTLDGQLHVKLPNGKETFVTPSELKDYKISDTDKYSPELEKEVESAVTDVLESDKFKELSKLLPENPTLKDKLDFVNTLQNKPLVDAIQSAVRKKTENIRKKQEELRKKEEELKKNEEISKQFFSTIKKLQSSGNEVVDEDLGDIGAMIDIVNIPYSGTEPKYEGTSEFNNVHRRNQEFLLNMFDNPKLAELYTNGQLRILPVTQKTQKHLGLDGIINPSYPNTIRYVYVIDASNGILSYIDKEGNAIPFTKNVDLNSIVFTTAREEDLSFSDKETGERLESYTNKENLSDSQIQEIKNLWKKQRETLLNADITLENVLDNTYRFTISRGLPNIVNTSAKNSVLDAKVISKSDLDNQVITVPSFKSGEKTTPVPINGLGTLINMPNGKPIFNYRGKMFFLNNRNFTTNEIETITEVLIRAAKQIVESGNVDSKLSDYLSGVIRFSETPTRNSIFLDGKEFTLQIGDKGQKLSLLTLDKNRELLNTLLANVYHHVSKEKVNEMKPFTEFSLKDGKLEETQHKNYQTYLLTGSQPVLTTNIIKPQENELPIIQKYPILDIKNMDVATIVSNKPATQPAPTGNLSSILDKMNAGLGKKTKEEVKVEPNKTADVANSMNSILKKGFGKGNFNEPQHRLVYPFKFSGNKADELAEIKRMLPQVHMEYVSNLIDAVGGMKAWGYALPKLITVYEGAPFGVGYHEAFEQVFNWILPAKEQLELYKEFTQRNGSFRTYNGEYKTFASANFKEAKEQMADEFAEFKATGKIPYAKKNTSNFFKRLWNLLKSLFTTKGNLESVFNNLNNGYYANSQIKTQTSEQQYKAVVNTPEALFQDTISGMTAELFMKKWNDDTSLILQLEDSDEATKPLFDQLYEGLNRFYTQEGDNTLDAYYGKLVEQNPEHLDKFLEEYAQVQKHWIEVSNQWDSYMSDLKKFLKVFDIAFTTDENGDIQLSSELQDEYEKLGGADSYTSESRMHLNAKNSASRAVKLLFATIADSNFVEAVTKNQIGEITRKYTGELATTRAENQMKLPNLAPYAKLFNYTLHNSVNTNGITKILDKLKSVVQNKKIKQNANLQRLLNRLNFNGTFESLPKETVKLLLKLENALSKNKPQFFRQYITTKEGIINQKSYLSSTSEQIIDGWINNIKSSSFTIVENDKIKFKPSVISPNKFTFLSNIGINFTPAEYELLPQSVKSEFDENVAKIMAEVKGYTSRFLPINTTRQNIGFSSRLETLAEIYTEYIEGDTSESQHANLDGEPYPNFILPNYVSFILNDTDTKTRDEFIRLNPQYRDIYMGSSHLLNNVLYDKDGKRTNKKIKVSLTEGIYDGFDNKAAHHNMTFSQRLVNEINNNLNGIYAALIPADAKTPWGLDMGNVVAKTAYFKREPESITDFVDAMWEAMIAEVNLAKDFPNRSFITQLNAINKETGRKVGEELRFFKGILSPKLVARIQEKLIDEGMQLNDEQLTSFKESFKAGLLTYVNKKASDTITNLRGYQLVESRNGKNTLFGIDKNFLKSIYGNKDRYILEDEKLQELFVYREMNYIYNNIELHRFLFNDPAQYKDETKRIKSFLSGREYAHSEENSGLNEALNVINNPNAIPSDWGYKQHKDQFNALTIKSVKTYNKDYESYRNNDIADAQSWAVGNTYYEMLWKSGGRTSSKQDDLHQWLMAWERQRLLEKGVISEDNYSKQLQKADIKILKSRIPEATMPVLKPIISGVSDNGIQYLYKTSTAPLYLYFVEGTPMEKTYIKAMKNNVEFIAMDSAHKVGQTVNNTVDWESDFTKDNIVPVKYKYFGIQVETSGSKDYQTQGSQLTKLATTNLLSNGMSVDFLKENESKSIDEKLAIWNSLTEAQKREKYPIYDLVKKHHQVLIDLTLERSKKLLDKLNIKKGEFGYSIDDKTSVAEFILSEVTRRELPQNIVTGIETNADGQFKSPIEANPNYKKIKEILYSTIENNILKPKVSGGPKILLSSLGYDNLNKENINGKDVYTTSKYKFYQEKDGKFVCQVGIPFVFGDKILGQIEKTIGKEFDTAREGYKHVLDYLNKTSEGKDLLRGIGFRIPTQGLNSVDHFEVVEFLPPQMGDVTIFPSEITTKAGSDFDVDKMNMYFKNWYINKDGYPEIIPFLGTDEKAKNKLSDIELSAILAKEVKADENALDKTKIEEDKPSFYLKSLENNYFSILGDILSLQENRDILLKPNDASGLEGVANKIDKLYGKEESSINYTNLLDSSWMLQKRQELLDSKKNVGIAAVSNTNLAVNQNTFFVVYPTDNYNLKQISRNFKWRFKHNSYGKDGVILSDRFNKNNELLSDLASQVIDGTVDVANKPWLPRLLGNSANLNVYNLLLKGGVDKYTAALFIHQPGVVEFLKRFDISVTDTQFKRKKKLYKGNVKYNMLKEQGISSKFQQQKFCDEKPELYSDSMMESFVGKDYNSLTKEEKKLQLQILDDYFMTDKQSSQSFSVVQTYNWDTTRFTNPESVTQKQLDLQNGFGISNIQGVKELLKNTQLATIVKSVLSASEGINSAFESYKGNSAAILNKIGLNMRTQFFSKDDRVKYSQRAEQSMIDYILQNNAEFKGQPLGKWIGTTLLSGNSIAHWVKEMQKISGLESNLFLQNIEPVIDVRDGYNSYIKMKEPDFDSFTSDRWTASLRELRDNFSIIKLGNNESTVSNIYNHMLISQILQYGTGKVKNSFLHIIPAEDFASIATPAISGNKSNLDTWLSEGLFYRNNYNNSDLVPEAPKEWIISTDTDGNEIESFETPIFQSQKFNEKLANKGYQTELLKLKSFGTSNNPFIKISNIEHDENGNVLSRSVTLYKRVDLSENEPLTIDNNQNVLYKKVNKLGNDNLKEYISTTSQLNENEKIKETPDIIIIQTLSESGIKYSSQPLTELISPDEFEENSLSLQETLDIKKDCK